MSPPAAIPTQTTDAYPGPRPFSTAEEKVFYGRDRERADVRDLVLSYRAVLLYAQSGAGKTSLINAGLLPLLKKEDCIISRVGGEIPPAMAAEAIENIFVFNALSSGLGGKVDARPLAQAALTGYFSRAEQQAEAYFLIFDQFEELFTAYPEKWEQREPFFRQIKELLSRNRNLHILFAIREEHIAGLDQYSEYLPDGFRIRYHLGRLRAPEATEAIVKPARLFGLPSIEALSEPIVENLQRVPFQTRRGVEVVRGEFVEPVHLQVVCRNLWLKLATDKSVPEAELKQLTDVDRALSEFYVQALRQAVQKNRVRESRLRQWFDQELITPAGTRGIVYSDPETERTGSIPSSAARILEEQHIVRQEPRAGSTWYELTHDRFIRPIRASNRVWRARRRRNSAIAGALCGLALLMAAISPLISNVLKFKYALEQTQMDAKQALQLAADATMKEQTAAERGRTLAALGLGQWKLGDYDKAESSFAQARELDAWQAMQAIDEGLRYAEQQKDPSLVLLQGARKSFLKKIEPYLRSSPELKRYVCAHNSYVIGASERLRDAEAERKRWLSEFPYAELGEPLTEEPRWTPIVMDYFLTCDEARAVLEKVQQKHKTGPFMPESGWYRGCGTCAVK